MKKYLLIAALLAAPVIAAKEKGVDWLDIPGRGEAEIKLDASRKPVETLIVLGLKKGDKALDYNAGNGYYTEILAKSVGKKGSVTAWNPAQFVNNPKAKARWTALLGRTPNAKQVVQPFDGFSADGANYNFVMLHLVYHDLYWESASFGVPRQNPDLFLKKLYAAVKKGGIVGVVDHVGTKGDTRVIVEKTHRIDPETVKADFLRAGFKLAGESNHLRITGDDYSKGVFDPGIRGKTDRFVLKFKK